MGKGVLELPCKKPLAVDFSISGDEDLDMDNAILGHLCMLRWRIDGTRLVSQKRCPPSWGCSLACG